MASDAIRTAASGPSTTTATASCCDGQVIFSKHGHHAVDPDVNHVQAVSLDNRSHLLLVGVDRPKT
nr:unnamed protein product [Digitaria exilis]